MSGPVRAALWLADREVWKSAKRSVMDHRLFFSAIEGIRIINTPPGSDLPDLECLGDGSRVLSFSTDDYFRSAPFFVILVGNRVIPVLL